MATHSSIFAWKVPWTEEPGRLQYMGSQSRMRLSNYIYICMCVCVCMCVYPQLWISVVKNLPANAGDQGSVPACGRSPGKEMATHSRILAWEIPWAEEPGGPQSMGLEKS